MINTATTIFFQILCVITYSPMFNTTPYNDILFYCKPCYNKVFFYFPRKIPFNIFLIISIFGTTWSPPAPPPKHGLPLCLTEEIIGPPDHRKCWKVFGIATLCEMHHARCMPRAIDWICPALVHSSPSNCFLGSERFRNNAVFRRRVLHGPLGPVCFIRDTWPIRKGHLQGHWGFSHPNLLLTIPNFHFACVARILEGFFLSLSNFAVAKISINAVPTFFLLY